MRERLGCIADDYTGATDLCSMLVRAGRRVLQCFGVPASAENEDLREADVVVVALKSRSVPATDAVRDSFAALGLLQSLGIERFFFKYCSTFDSTPAGNIGPVAEALSAALGTSKTWYCPAFPENGRTVHCGYLFVDGVLLGESGMRDHPLNPMTDSHLVRVLQAQASRRVTWYSPRTGRGDPMGPNVIIDAIDDDDLRAAAHRSADHRLLTGGSAVARFWVGAAGIRHSGDWCPVTLDGGDEMRSVILAGSCSEATRRQVAEFERTCPVFHLAIESDAEPGSIAEEAIGWCETRWRDGDASDPLLIASGVRPDSLAASRERWGGPEAAARTERTFAEIASGLRDRSVRRLVVAGGETSGAVINALGIQAVRIGREIAPGVPWVTSIGASPMQLALKSGNFGGPRFFFDAFEGAP